MSTQTLEKQEATSLDDDLTHLVDEERNPDLALCGKQLDPDSPWVDDDDPVTCEPCLFMQALDDEIGY